MEFLHSTNKSGAPCQKHQNIVLPSASIRAASVPLYFSRDRMKNFTINLSCLIYSRVCILLCNDFVYFQMGPGRGSPVNFFREFYGYALLCSRLEQINKEMILGIETPLIYHTLAVRITCGVWRTGLLKWSSKNIQHESGMFYVLQIEPNQLMVIRGMLFLEVVKFYRC